MKSDDEGESLNNAAPIEGHNGRILGHRGYSIHDSTARMLKLLEDFENLTQPSVGEHTAVGKGEKAASALRIAGNVVELMAGWAIDHMIGVELSEQKPLHKRAKEYSEYDSHLFEECGASYDWTDHKINRRVAATMVRELLPEILADELFTSLDALDAGEVLPMLEATTHTGQKGPKLTLAHERMKALKHVAYRQGKGMSGAKAREEVAEVYDHYVDKRITVRMIADWKIRAVPSALSINHVTDILKLVEHHGNVTNCLIFGKPIEGLSHESLVMLANGFEEQYSNDALRADAQSYQELVGGAS